MHFALKKTARPTLAGPITHAIGKRLDHAEHSHGEIIFSDGMSASSVIGEGVRFKRIIYDPTAWDFFTLPNELEKPVLSWYVDHWGEPYDYLYMLRFGLPLLKEIAGKWGCIESMGAAKGWTQPYRYGPGGYLARCKDQYGSRQVCYDHVFKG